MTIESWQFGNPERVAERGDERPVRTCAGCVHIRIGVDPLSGRRVLKCALGLPVGQRCNRYEERNAEGR